MMRCGDIAHGVDRADHLLLADNDIVEQAFQLRRDARIDQRRIGLFEDAEQRQAGLGRHDVLSLGHQKALFLQPADDLGSRRRRADALGFLQAFPQHLIVNEAPGILHRLDQRAFVVARRWPGLLVLDFWILQLRGLAVAQRRKQLRLVALFVGGLPLRECCAPAEIDGLAAGGAEFEATHVERCGGLPVAEVGHQGGQIGPRDDVEQFLLVGRQARPDLPQLVDRVDVGNDGVMARALQPLVVESCRSRLCGSPADRARGLR